MRGSNKAGSLKPGDMRGTDLLPKLRSDDVIRSLCTNLWMEYVIAKAIVPIFWNYWELKSNDISLICRNSLKLFHYFLMKHICEYYIWSIMDKNKEKEKKKKGRKEERKKERAKPAVISSYSPHITFVFDLHPICYLKVQSNKSFSFWHTFCQDDGSLCSACVC